MVQALVRQTQQDIGQNPLGGPGGGSQELHPGLGEIQFDDPLVFGVGAAAADQFLVLELVEHVAACGGMDGEDVGQLRYLEAGIVEEFPHHPELGGTEAALFLDPFGMVLTGPENNAEIS